MHKEWRLKDSKRSYTISLFFFGITYKRCERLWTVFSAKNQETLQMSIKAAFRKQKSKPGVELQVQNRFLNALCPNSLSSKEIMVSPI